MPTWRARRLAVAAAVAALIVSAGCDVLTTARLPPVRDDRIVGTWKDIGLPGEQPNDDVTVVRVDGGEYVSGSPDDFAKNKATRFTLARVGSALLFQAPAETNYDLLDVFRIPKRETAWILGRVELTADELHTYQIDADRLARDSTVGKLRIDHEVHRTVRGAKVEHAVLLRGDSAALQTFLESYLKDPTVFKLTGRSRRVTP